MKIGAIIFLWVIHLSALIGIALGYADFFLPKSPFTLMYLLVLLITLYALDNLRALALFAICFATGMIVEWVGVHTELLFGEYYYGVNFGPKLDGIPFLIGINWAILVLITHVLAGKISKSLFLKSALGAGLMVLLDFFLEQICDFAGFWHFTGGAGWFNYLCWFVIAYFLQLIAGRLKVNGDTTISFHLYSSQLVFTAVLWLIIMT
jgi:putative membrane protein